MRKRKGSLQETLSYCMHKEDPNLFVVSYRDRKSMRTDSLADFMTKEELSDIPITRIVRINRGKLVVWKKGQKSVSVKLLK